MRGKQAAQHAASCAWLGTPLHASLMYLVSTPAHADTPVYAARSLTAARIEATTGEASHSPQAAKISGAIKRMLSFL